MIYWKLKALFTPSCWIQNQCYCELFDAWLISQLDKKEVFKDITIFGACFASVIGGRELWIENHPYASYRPTRSGFRASRATTLRARAWHLECLKQEWLNGST